MIIPVILITTIVAVVIFICVQNTTIDVLNKDLNKLNFLTSDYSRMLTSQEKTIKRQNQEISKLKFILKNKRGIK